MDDESEHEMVNTLGPATDDEDESEEAEEAEQIDKVIEKVESTTLFDRLNEMITKPTNTHHKLDSRRQTIFEQIKHKFKSEQHTLVSKAEAKKSGIERQLEDTDNKLSDLLAYGEELVTNIKVTTQQRELKRKQFEVAHSNILKADLQKESIESLAHYNTIASRWLELGHLKEPVALHEALAEQQQRLAGLMASKDSIIAQCQQEMERINRKYYEDQRLQSNDVSSIVERVDNQIELIRESYKKHLHLLENTIEDERQTIRLNAENKWHEFYGNMSINEAKKFEIAKEKQKFYNHEIARISGQQEEITRCTRRRLDKDAEALELELRTIKNSVFMNAEKLDYNYQVLQKRKDENGLINNQQKRRVAKCHENITQLRKKTEIAVQSQENEIRKLTNDIEKLHASISELEKKSQAFRLSNLVKFNRVWEINFKEVNQLLAKVFEIDRILHEQQLAMPWVRPEVDFININEETDISVSNSSVSLEPRPSSLRILKYRKSFVKRKPRVKNSKDELIERRFLRNVLRKIADRAGFLVEEKLLKLLQPYNEEQKCVVRIDNIFNALRIHDVNTVTELVAHFHKYAWCPNCMPTNEGKTLKNLYRQASEQVSTHSLKDQTKSFGPRKSKYFASHTCDNHYLVIEPALVLTCLNEFTNKQSTKTVHTDGFIEYDNKIVNLISMNNETIKNFWHKFSTYMPVEKEKLWIALEHGLNHYFAVLKRRVQLDAECAFLRKQNTELKHLLQKFEV